MTSSSRRLRRPLPRGGRLALVVPTALLAITAMVSPSFADDVNPDDGGDPPAVTETPAAEPEPTPEAEPKPEPKPEPKDDPKPEPKPEPKDEPKDEPEAEEPEAEEPAPELQEVPADAVPAGEEADEGAKLIQKVVPALLDPVFNTDKMVVCKYGSTPEIGEKAVTVNISSVNSLDIPVNWNGLFPVFFGDAQDSSISPRYAYEGENTNDVLDLIDILCPPYVPPGLVVAPELTVNDPCGPGNAAYNPVPAGNYSVTINPDGSILLTANTGYVFEGDLPTHSYPAPVDSNAPCPATAPDEPAVTDDCGPDNAYFTTVPESTEEYTVVAEPAEKPTTITITANEGFVFDPDAPVVYTAVDSDEPCIGAAPAEPDVIDDCGPDNAYYTNVPESTEEYTVVAEPAEKPTTITITANEGFVFTPDAPVVYTVEDSGDLCVVVAPEEPDVTDDCGPGNAYYTTVPESTEEYTVVAEPEVNPTKITITATEGNAFDEQDTLVIVYEVTDSGEACPIYVACVYPTAQVDDVAPRVALSLIPKGVLAIVDQAEALLNGFLGTFPYTYAQGVSEVTILQELPDGVDLSAFDAATLCGAVAGIVEEPPTVGGIVEALPDTGGPAGFLVPLGTGLVLAGAALVLLRRRETV